MIAGAGFALMAWELAQKRTHRSYMRNPLSHDSRHGHLPTYEYYRICDRAWNAWHFRDFSSDPSRTLKL